jgi:H+-transporting ATPase
MVWAYALAWFLVTDPVKLLAYHVLDATKPTPAPLAKAESELDTKRSAQPDVNVEEKSDAVPKVPGEPVPLSDATPPAKPEVQVEPKSEAAAKIPAKADPPSADKPTPKADSNAAPQPKVDASVTALANTTLGELLVAGLPEDPKDAGRVIAEGIVQTKARIDVGKTPLVETAPKEPK